MWSAAGASIWETWRLTRVRLVVVPTLATLCGWLWSKSAGSFLAFVVLFVAAIAMAMLLPSFGAGPGFPLAKSFARPIRTSVLVAAPLSYIFAAAAGSYLVPAAFLRAFVGADLPLIPVATFIGGLAVIVAGARWVTRDVAGQTGLAIAAYIAAAMLVKLLDPFKYAGSPFATKGVKASPELFVLSGFGYLVLLVVIAGVYLAILFAVTQQRHGDEKGAGRDTSTIRSPREKGDIFGAIRDTCIDVCRWRCPVSSPIAAEFWFEMQCYGIPVLTIGMLLTLCIPLLIYWGNSYHTAIPLVLAACTFLGPFLAGVGASIWNRRDASGAKFPAFEAARPSGTAQLVGFQVLVTSACIFAAWLLMGASFWLNLSPSPVTRSLELIQRHGLRLLSASIVGFASLTTAVAFLAALRASATLNGSRLWRWSGGLAAYVIAVIVAVAREWIGAFVIDVNLWILAIAIASGTPIVLRTSVARGFLMPRQIGKAAVAWLIFAVLYLDLLRAYGPANAPAAVAAVGIASALLPLMATGIAPLSLGRLRHA